MQNFRQFEAGPDPFGRKFQVLFKWMQTAISLRHADTVDVKFILVDDQGGRTEKTMALPHADLVRVATEAGRKVDDPWCSRLGAMHLRRLVETGEDMEKDLVTLSAADMKGYAEQLRDSETSAVRAGERRRKPGTDTKFPAQFAGNWLSVPGFASRNTTASAIFRMLTLVQSDDAVLHLTQSTRARGRHGFTAGSSGLCVRGPTLGPLGFAGGGAGRHLASGVVVVVIGPADQEPRSE